MMLRSCMARMLRDERGQATVEAAFAVPVLMVLVLMLVQPGIILYDRIVMEGAAAGCWRRCPKAMRSYARTSS